ncbi:addiction module antitoxin [Endozoicomonas numazuensis]|uniref:Addiction module antitoxin n=2 Tax=Endozoicomonas numazuensis TaxID=1137799 RepID=A0A081NL98_9GAMM|nr:addiction module antitoxin [Endozoicomonas numazuensis]
MTANLLPYDPAEYLDSPEAIEAFLAEAFTTEDPSYIAKAIGVAARAEGMAKVAKKAGLSREQLYRSFSEKGNPTLKTIISVMQALGLHLKLTSGRT